MAICREEHLYYWAEAVEADESHDTSYIHGFYFECGEMPASKRPDQGKRCWEVSPSGKREIVAAVNGVHRVNRGWGLRIERGSLGTLPSLITTDPRINCVFDHDVDIESNDPSVDLVWLCGDGIGLCGHNWFGVAAATTNGVRLTAFSHSGTLVFPADAYYPDWGGGNEAESFRVRISARR